MSSIIENETVDEYLERTLNPRELKRVYVHLPDGEIADYSVIADFLTMFLIGACASFLLFIILTLANVR